MENECECACVCVCVCVCVIDQESCLIENKDCVYLRAFHLLYHRPVCDEGRNLIQDGRLLVPGLQDRLVHSLR